MNGLSHTIERELGNLIESQYHKEEGEEKSHLKKINSIYSSF
jgi:hypothetical protein